MSDRQTYCTIAGDDRPWTDDAETKWHRIDVCSTAARNHCFRTLRRILSYVQMREAPYDNRTFRYVIGCALSVVFLEIRSEHIDIDAASFGIIERRKRVFYLACSRCSRRSLEFKVLRSASSPSLRILHDPLQYWAVLVAMSAFQFH
jgi:hypothetical protein